MFSRYFNQTVGHKACIGYNERVELAYGEEKPIKVRLDWDEGIIMNVDGKEVTTNGKVLTHAELKQGDIIVYEREEYIVANVKPMVDISGNLVHYEARI